MILHENKPRAYRVLSLDGGGTRGIYTAAYLHGLLNVYARLRGVQSLDLGKGFDLIVGTSTGALVGCAAAAGVSMDKVVDLYRQHGPQIFQQPIYNDWRVIRNFIGRSRSLARGAEALEKALTGVLGEATLGSLYSQRQIAVAVPSVELSRHRAYVFKTAHLGGKRDDDYRLVDVCLATTAAPIFRSLAAVKPNDGLGVERVFADGGLWANNPVLVGLLDALRATEPSIPIEIFAMGTCPRPEGEQVSSDDLDRGLWGWKFGAKAAQLSLAAQESAFDHMARLLANELARQGRTVKVYRFPSDKVAASLLPYLDMDNATPRAMDALVNQARTDVDLTKSRCDDPNDPDGAAIRSLFMSLPENEKVQENV
ncbi:patatin-like phospholipase family protein [Rhodomicrobium sp. Az07]|uniref:patatin-like phospholipase family protein n=1 Tax=Rhodomicrobium sp. Az07 TaxID=2839034 RepID=UPI001BEA6C89|nr:patatin-like phospholipase family protein [Rhodomicrobium sp. Az07]MBT3071428.1 patatin-like phospholipase family protein [Rhodomicrobium sp. Az07]